MSSRRPAVICIVFVAQLVGGTTFPLRDVAGQNGLGLIDSLSSQRLLPVAETKIPELLPEFDPNNPPATGIILAFHHWPGEVEQKIILKKTVEAGLTKTEEIPRFKIWLFEWNEWRKAAAAENVCHGLLVLSFVEYCEPDVLLDAATRYRNPCCKVKKQRTQPGD